MHSAAETEGDGVKQCRLKGNQEADHLWKLRDYSRTVISIIPQDFYKMVFTNGETRAGRWDSPGEFRLRLVCQGSSHHPPIAQPSITQCKFTHWILLQQKCTLKRTPTPSYISAAFTMKSITTVKITRSETFGCCSAGTRRSRGNWDTRVRSLQREPELPPQSKAPRWPRGTVLLHGPAPALGAG